MKRDWRTHYAIVLANFILVLLTGINFAVKNLIIDRVMPPSIDDGTIAMDSINLYFLLIAPFISILISGFLYYLDIKYFFKDYSYKKFHFNKKWTKFYLSGISIFCFNLILIFVLVSIAIYLGNNIKMDFIGKPTNFDDAKNEISNIVMIFLWIIFSITILFSLISLSFIKYARFKIDVELLQREKGTIVDKDKIDNKSVIINLDDNKSNFTTNDDKPVKEKDKPSAGLTEI
ncbi:DUF5453 family protein [Mycoplasmoides pirum]|uniref:DUF5453 family protein n=1 Tax=Mycoplasmoides pirum TaxID=2122 RepID=UPI00047F477A|nr:DUF5453 family protein [Mycoplasmoides pirum]